MEKHCTNFEPGFLAENTYFHWSPCVYPNESNGFMLGTTLGGEREHRVGTEDPHRWVTRHPTWSNTWPMDLVQLKTPNS